MAKNYVYFMRNPDNGHIKIGQSIHPDKRRRQVQRDAGANLKIMATLEDVPLERVLHERFASCRLHGEWFRPTPELLKFIKENEGRADKWSIKKAADDVSEGISTAEAVTFELAVLVLVFGGAIFYGIVRGLGSLMMGLVWAVADLIQAPTRANIDALIFEHLFWLVVVLTAPVLAKVVFKAARAETEAQASNTAKST